MEYLEYRTMTLSFKDEDKTKIEHDSWYSGLIKKI